jgi:large subunit ribosomal protein L35
MPKVKTRKAIAKRVKVTARGKLIVRAPGSGHLKSRKSPSQLRRMRKPKNVSAVYVKTVMRMLGR